MLHCNAAVQLLLTCRVGQAMLQRSHPFPLQRHAARLPFAEPPHFVHAGRRGGKPQTATCDALLARYSLRTRSNRCRVFTLDAREKRTMLCTLRIFGCVECRRLRGGLAVLAAQVRHTVAQGPKLLRRDPCGELCGVVRGSDVMEPLMALHQELLLSLDFMLETSSGFKRCKRIAQDEALCIECLVVLRCGGDSCAKHLAFGNHLLSQAQQLLQFVLLAR